MMGDAPGTSPQSPGGPAPPVSAPPARVTWLAVLGRRLTIALVCLGASAAIVYPTVTRSTLLDPGLGGPKGDVGQYVNMYRGEPLASIVRPFRYRVFTPFAARLVPVPPQALLRYFDLGGDRLIQLRFGLVNMIGLAVGGALLVAFCQALGFTMIESLLAALLFYTAFPVVNFGGTAMVDAWGYVFLLLGLLAIQSDAILLLAAAGVIGMFAKETTGLLVPAAFLLPGTRGRVFARLAALVPGLALYAVFRVVLFPGGYGLPGDPATSIENLVYRLQHGPYLAWIAWDGGTAFLALWPLALLGWLEARRVAGSPLARLSWLVPAILLTPFLIGSNIGRIWFYAFPIMIPLAVVGLRRLLWPAARATA
jgi:hypothetical protein